MSSLKRNINTETENENKRLKKKIDNNQLFFKNHINIIDTSNVNIDVKIKLYENIFPE